MQRNRDELEKLGQREQAEQQHAQRQAERFRRLEQFSLDGENKRKYGARAQKWEDQIEMFRRKAGSDGQQIIDKPACQKLTRKFPRRDGIIIRGKEAERHLGKQGAYAAYFAGGNYAFIRDNAAVPDAAVFLFCTSLDVYKNLGMVTLQQRKNGIMC